MTGVRWAESYKRKSRGIYESLARTKENKIIINNDNDDRRILFESCRIKSRHICNPIVDWSDRDVWEYIRAEKIWPGVLPGGLCWVSDVRKTEIPGILHVPYIRKGI